MGLRKREYKDEETLITAENLNDIQDAILDLEDGLFSIDNNKSGEAIAITDAAKRGFRSLNIYGKTTQDGTPTPDAPMELVSVGDSGSISVKIASVNLAEPMRDTAFTDTGVTFSPTGDGNLILNGTVSGELWKSIYRVATVRGQTYTVSGALGVRLVVWCTETEQQVAWKEPNQPYISFTANYSKYVLCVSHNANETFNNLRVDCTAYPGTTPLLWTPYNGQSVTISTPNGLPGIPVASGGNYTDSNGQQWICDEIDFARGVYVQRIKRFVLSTDNSNLVVAWGGDGGFVVSEIGIADIDKCVICDKLISQEYIEIYKGEQGVNVNKGHDQLVFAFSGVTTIDGLKTWLQSNSLTFLYAMEAATETPLPEEEFAAYAALHTYKEHTTVSNDAGAWMDLEYVMDAKKYIDSLVISGGGSILPATVE